MKFIAKESTEGEITKSQVYWGSIVNTFNHSLKIAVWNDEGILTTYPTSYFNPYKEQDYFNKAVDDSWSGSEL